MATIEHITSVVIPEKHKKRALESLQIRGLGEKAVAAYGVMHKKYLNSPALDVERTQKEMLSKFRDPTTPRKILIETLETIEKTVNCFWPLNGRLNKENSFAYHLRRIYLTSFIIQNEIEDGPQALEVADFMLGQSPLRLESMELVKECHQDTASI
ncbi:hypothetical protein HYT59_00490 [Candidatus Woesebacteria bacterium]|nr:hypothetical protein [Candidatus Woesebacteria bacterium]